jgi:2-polyprenyl-3-methyl-5-hydroxy-6-metoxy-1,4-benzoquinol methylase
MFRVPKNSPEENRAFYQEEYHEGFTTDCPGESDLSILMATSFRGSEKDYSEYIEVVRAAGVKSGQVILDYGSSWGYGSWQLMRAGFNVYSYEISEPRAAYAAEKLAGQMLRDPEQIPERADCFFSAHVIEHLPNPRVLWKHAARVLKPDGVIILFMPNGESSLEKTKKDYHSVWGQVHPLLLSAAALSIMAREYGFHGHAYSTPHDLSRVANEEPGSLNGDELLFIARRVK